LTEDENKKWNEIVESRLKGLNGYLSIESFKNSLIKLLQDSLELSEEEQKKTISYPQLPDLPDWPTSEKLKKERELLGFYISGHPLEPYKPILKLYATDVDKLREAHKQGAPLPRLFNIAGQITDIRTLYDRKQQKMGFVKIEDFQHTYEVVVFGSVFPQFEQYLQADNIVFIQGRLNSDLDDNVLKFIGERILHEAEN
jgi:DNA polymerase-3 subunit alpha